LGGVPVAPRMSLGHVAVRPVHAGRRSETRRGVRAAFSFAQRLAAYKVPRRRRIRSTLRCANDARLRRAGRGGEPKHDAIAGLDLYSVEYSASVTSAVNDPTPQGPAWWSIGDQKPVSCVRGVGGSRDGLPWSPIRCRTSSPLRRRTTPPNQREPGAEASERLLAPSPNSHDDLLREVANRCPFSPVANTQPGYRCHPRVLVHWSAHLGEQAVPNLCRAGRTAALLTLDHTLVAGPGRRQSSRR